MRLPHLLACDVRDGGNVMCYSKVVFNGIIKLSFNCHLLAGVGNLLLTMCRLKVPTAYEFLRKSRSIYFLSESQQN